MIIVQDTFVCKPGNASKLAKLMRDWANVVPKKESGKIVYILTDMTGQWHRVIMVSEFKDLTTYDEMMKNMGKNQTPKEKAMMKKFANMNEMCVSGSREIYKVW